MTGCVRIHLFYLIGHVTAFLSIHDPRHYHVGIQPNPLLERHRLLAKKNASPEPDTQEESKGGGLITGAAVLGGTAILSDGVDIVGGTALGTSVVDVTSTVASTSALVESGHSTTTIIQPFYTYTLPPTHWKRC